MSVYGLAQLCKAAHNYPRGGESCVSVLSVLKFFNMFVKAIPAKAANEYFEKLVMIKVL